MKGHFFIRKMANNRVKSVPKFGLNLSLAFSLSYLVMQTFLLPKFFQNVFSLPLLDSVMWITGHTLILELFDSVNRKRAYVINSVWFCLVNLITPGIVYFVRDWTQMHLWIGGIIVLAIPPVLLGLEARAYFLQKQQQQQQQQRL